MKDNKKICPKCGSDKVQILDEDKHREAGFVKQAKCCVCDAWFTEQQLSIERSTENGFCPLLQEICRKDCRFFYRREYSNGVWQKGYNDNCRLVIK